MILLCVYKFFFWFCQFGQGMIEYIIIIVLIVIVVIVVVIYFGGIVCVQIGGMVCEFLGSFVKQDINCVKNQGNQVYVEGMKDKIFNSYDNMIVK